MRGRHRQSKTEGPMSQSASAEHQPTESPADDIGADLRASFDAAETAAPAEVGGEPSPVETKERARDESGRFAKTAAEKAHDAEVGGAAEPAPEGAAAPSGAGAPLEIPKNWPAEVRADLERLAKTDPALAKRWIDQTRYFQGIAQTERQKAEPFMRLQSALEDVLAPTRQTRQMQGMDDAQYLRALAAADQFLAKNPAEGIKWLAQKYGLTPEQLVGQIEDARANAPDPRMQELARRLEQQEAFIRQVTQGAQQQALSGVVSQIEAFASAKGADGSPLHPYFDDCLSDIQFLVQAQRERGEPVNLEAAYAKAVRMNDTVWMRLQSQQAEKQAAERAAAAEKARRAGFSVTGSGEGARSTDPADTLRGELERQFEKHS